MRGGDARTTILMLISRAIIGPEARRMPDDTLHYFRAYACSDGDDRSFNVIVSIKFLVRILMHMI